MLSKKILDTIPVSIRTIRRLSANSIENNELTFQQLRILILTYEGMGATQMANTTQVSTAAVSKMVDNLVKKKFLIREQGSDRRCQKLKLTSMGDKVRKLVRKKVETELEKHLKKLSNKEQEDLVKGLDVLQKLMEYVNEK